MEEWGLKLQSFREMKLALWMCVVASGEVVGVVVFNGYEVPSFIAAESSSFPRNPSWLSPILLSLLLHFSSLPLIQPFL
ncbi:unnamed protein product [Prunus armeniaca]